MQKYWNTVQDEKGNPREGASVAVQQNSVNSTIFADQNGLIPKVNPLTTDARGYFEFYAAAGEYDLVVSGSGFDSYTITDGALIGLPSADVTFTSSGSGALSTNLQTRGRKFTLTSDYSSVADFQTATGLLTEIAGFAGFQTVQATEAVGSTILNHKWATSGNAPFKIQQTSAANTGAGAGTYNHAVWFGYNVDRHSSIGTPTSGKSALIMGMEDNFYDDGGDNAYASEWYVEYFSPDGSSVQLYRPYYARVYNGDNTKHHAQIYQDIGTDGNGTWNLFKGIGTTIIAVTPSLVTTSVPITVGGKLTANFASFISTITKDTSNDRVSVGTLSSLPTSSNGAYIGWSEGNASITGTLAGDLCLIPRSSVNGAVRVFTGNGTPSQALSVDVSGNVQKYGTNGAYWEFGSTSELLTLSTSGATTDTSANLLPADAIIEAVVARVTTTITTATDWKLGDATISGRFAGANSTMTAGATSVGTVHADQTGTSGPRQTAAAKVRVTTTGTPGAGVIRIEVFYRKFVAPTS